MEHGRLLKEKLRNNKYFLSAVILLIIVGNVIYHVFYYDNYEFAENGKSEPRSASITVTFLKVNPKIRLI